MELVIIIPHRDRIRNGYAMKSVMGFSIIVIRSMPYPPSFRRMAARTIEPAIGASTCAFGNQRCRP